MISDAKKKKLRAAGYTIGSSGSVVEKDGKTIGGINKNGGIFSGSSEVRAILKGSDEKPKDSPKEKPKARSNSTRKPSAPSSSKRPMRRTGKLNDDAKAARTNSSERTSQKPTTDGGPRRSRGGPKPKMSASPQVSSTAPTQPVAPKGNTINGVSFEKWKDMSRAERVAKNLPLTNQEWSRERTKENNPTRPQARPEPKPESKRGDRARRRNMNKGGQVTKGHTDRKNGMFYKSGSPKGYK